MSNFLSSKKKSKVMSDFLSPKKKKKKKNSKALVTFLQKKKVTVRNKPEKMTKQIYLKTSSVGVKVSPITKSAAVMTVAFVDTSTPNIYGKDKEVYPDKLYLEVSCDVHINGHSIGGYTLRRK